MREIFLYSAFLPYLGFSLVDFRLHFRVRKVSVLEHACHAGVAFGMVLILISLWSKPELSTPGLLFLLVFGTLDELAFHRELPHEESDAHAKAHWSLLFALCVCVIYGRFSHFPEIALDH